MKLDRLSQVAARRGAYIALVHAYLRSVGRLALRIVVAGLFAFPLVWLVFASLLPDNQPLSAVWRLRSPFQLTLANYATAADMVPMGRFALNSLQVLVMALPLTLLVASLAGFALSQLPPRVQRAGLWLSLAALLAPPTALWLARFPIFRALGWVDSPWPLVAPAFIGGSPFFVLLFYWAFHRLSPELFEAAILDGAGAWQLWQYVAWPLSGNTAAGVLVLSFVLFWGNFTDPLLYLRTQAHMTLPVGLRLLAQLDITRWPVVMAGAALLTLPAVLLFVVGQRFFWYAWDLVDQSV